MILGLMKTKFFRQYALKSTKSLPKEKFDSIVLAVSHNKFINIDLSSLKKETAVIYDVKGVLGEKADKNL